MDDKTKSILKIAALGVAAYIGYRYLQNSGLWAQWFGGGTSFTDPQTLLNYCQANPAGSATYVNAAGQSRTGTCAQWTQAAAASQPSSGSGGGSFAAPGAAEAALATALIQAAKVSDSTKMNVWQWNYILQHMTPAAANLNTSSNAAEMTAADYAALRKSNGLMGLRWNPEVQLAQLPYRWLN